MGESVCDLFTACWNFLKREMRCVKVCWRYTHLICALDEENLHFWFSSSMLLSVTLSFQFFFCSYMFCLLGIQYFGSLYLVQQSVGVTFNPLNPELNPICYLLALLGAHHFLHVSRIRVKLLTFRRLMSYIYIYGAPILDVSRSHTTTQHSR